MLPRLPLSAACIALVAAAAPLWAADPIIPPDFNAAILPILQAKCIRCHGEKRKAGKLDMRTIQAMLAGGESGPAFKPGDAGKSLLVELIHFNEMPPKKEQPRVTKEELELLRGWINGLPK